MTPQNIFFALWLLTGLSFLIFAKKQAQVNLIVSIIFITLGPACWICLGLINLFIKLRQKYPDTTIAISFFISMLIDIAILSLLSHFHIINIGLKL